MKFKILSLEDALKTVPGEEKTSKFLNVYIHLKNAIEENFLEEELLIDYIFNLTIILNKVNDTRDVKDIASTVFRNKIFRIIENNKIELKEMEDFLRTISMAIYKTRYETIDGNALIGSDLDSFESYNDFFNEESWLKKNKLIF